VIHQHEYMQSASKLPRVPASLFGIVLGLAGLGNTWRTAHRVWRLPVSVGELLFASAAIVWAILLVLFGLKWLVASEDAKAELEHPVHSTYISLIGVATNLIAIGAYPYWHTGAVMLFVPAATISIIHGVFFTSFAWSGRRHSGENTGSLYLPTVASCFVTGTAAATLGYKGLAQLAFGAGILSWFSIESVILHRLYAEGEIPPAQRPSLGIQFAPAAVGVVTYLSITGGTADIFSRALLGYAILQALVLLRMSRWLFAHPLDASYWAFTFGAASLATAALRMVEHGEQGLIHVLAPVLFVGANITVAGISLVTIVCCFQGNLIPRPVGKPSEIAGGKLEWSLAETLNAVATKDPQTLTVYQQNSADPATRDDPQARLTWNEEAGLLQATTEP
jgi:tellurite resistance protein